MTGDLLTVAALVAGLLVAVLLKLLLEARLQLADLAVLDVVVTSTSGSVGLEELDLVLDRSVEYLGLGNNGLEGLVGRSIGAVESALMGRSNLGNVLGQLADVGFGCLDARKEVLVAEHSRRCLLHWCLRSGGHTAGLRSGDSIGGNSGSLRCAVLRVLGHGRVVGLTLASGCRGLERLLLVGINTLAVATVGINIHRCTTARKGLLGRSPRCHRGCLHRRKGFRRSPNIGCCYCMPCF